MTEEKKYEFYDENNDTYTFRGEVLEPVRVGFEVVYRSESYELRRVAWDCSADTYTFWNYEVLERGEIMKWGLDNSARSRGVRSLLGECERVECVGR